MGGLGRPWVTGEGSRSRESGTPQAACGAAGLEPWRGACRRPGPGPRRPAAGPRPSALTLAAAAEPGRLRGPAWRWCRRGPQRRGRAGGSAPGTPPASSAVPAGGEEPR